MKVKIIENIESTTRLLQFLSIPRFPRISFRRSTSPLDSNTLRYAVVLILERNAEFERSRYTISERKKERIE